MFGLVSSLEFGKDFLPWINSLYNPEIRYFISPIYEGFRFLKQPVDIPRLLSSYLVCDTISTGILSKAIACSSTHVDELLALALYSLFLLTLGTATSWYFSSTSYPAFLSVSHSCTLLTTFGGVSLPADDGPKMPLS